VSGTPTRVSSDRTDPGFRPDYFDWEVWLDGVRQTMAVMADAALGECLLVTLHPGGRGFLRSVARGAVEIRRRSA
jgi:hypothetical protein